MEKLTQEVMEKLTHQKLRGYHHRTVTILMVHKLIEKEATEKHNKVVTLAEKMAQICRSIDGFIHELPRKKIMEDAKNRLAKFETGEKGPSGPGKVLMLVGATGAGKSTLINGMINYVYGVKWEDPFRFKLIVDEGAGKSEAQSQTKWITAYVIHQQEGFRLPSTLTLIDTPGFGDTEGIKADDELKIQIHEFFSHGGNIGVDQLDGICFVTTPVSLTLTQDVLKERKHLEAALQGILPQIKTAMARAERVRQTYLALKQHEAEADANKNFKYNVKVPKHKKIDLDSGTYVTNCLNCNSTCHYPCYIPNNKDKAGCAAMRTVEGTACCKVCPKNCIWHKHVNNEYRFETYEEEEEHTYHKLKKKYEEASGKRLNAKGVLNELIKDFNVERTNVLKLTKEAHQCLQKLDKIALKPDPLGITEYIDLLIESEKREAKPGFEQRITYLLDAKDKAKLAENLKDDFDPLEACMKEFRDL
ncbi:unnamed protein product, partial [Darwinula stevensoni]